MKKGKDKTGLVQLCHQHCAPLCDDIVGRDRNCAGRAPRLWDRRTRVTRVETGIWKRKLTQTLAHKEARLQDGSSENSMSELR